MDRQSRVMTPRDLECMLCDETAEPKLLPLQLLEEITDGFSIDQEIGRGTFAVVYRGKLEKRTVAVKRMSNAFMDEKVFHREVQCLMMAKHNNIVRFLGYCADRQGIMEKYEGKLVMADVHQRLLCFEYLPKGSLLDYITDTTSGLQWRDRYHIIKGICQGLHYLHQINIVHLDLKPGNILLDGNLVVKIADFGLSRCFDEKQSRIITANIGGTLGYLAPEFDSGEITYHFDIYSLGVILMEILTGKKGYCAVEKVVERWNNRMEESPIEVQLEQVKVCAEIGIECTNFDPAKRPDTNHIISRLNETESIERYIDSGVIASGQNKPDLLIATMHVLWLRYQQLNPNIRRCIEFCSIFAIGSKLRKDELVRLWIALGFVKASCATKDMEDIAWEYIEELVSSSFLQPTETSSDTKIFTIPNVLHYMLEKVAGNCFRIENPRRHSREGWEGYIPRDIQHLLIQNYHGELINEKILGLENLRTLLIYVVGKDTLIEEKVIDSICKRLPKLQVLAIAFSKEHDPIEQPEEFSFPESVGQLEYLRYLAFRTKNYCRINLPSTINKLRHIQLLDFGHGEITEFTFAELVNLRHIFCWEYVNLAYVGKLSSLQTLLGFRVSDEQGCDLKQLRDLNKLQGKLCIGGLQNVKSKAQALQANLIAKERLTELSLRWWNIDDEPRCSREVEADVLEGLCPPVGLQKLELFYFAGCRYPDWMVGKHSGGPKYLQELILVKCSQPVHASGLAEAFPHLSVLEFCFCSWDDLPGNMEHLTSLKKLNIHHCKNILSLPSLPQSLEEFLLEDCNDEFMKSCQTVGHANWQKIEHIPSKLFC